MPRGPMLQNFRCSRVDGCKCRLIGQAASANSFLAVPVSSFSKSSVTPLPCSSCAAIKFQQFTSSCGFRTPRVSFVLGNLLSYLRGQLPFACFLGSIHLEYTVYTSITDPLPPKASEITFCFALLLISFVACNINFIVFSIQELSVWYLLNLGQCKWFYLMHPKLCIRRILCSLQMIAIVGNFSKHPGPSDLTIPPKRNDLSD